MTALHLAVLLVALSALIFILELVRRRELREKYAVLWVVLGVAMTVLALFPNLLIATAERLGVIEPANLLFFVALLVLLLVVIHLSWEISRVERRNRRLAEEVAILVLERQLEHELDPRGGAAPSPEGSSPGEEDVEDRP